MYFLICIILDVVDLMFKLRRHGICKLLQVLWLLFFLFYDNVHFTVVLIHTIKAYTEK
jgi:hypothetical protein